MRNGEKIRVCKKMFLSTLGIGERTVIEWKNFSSKSENLEINQDTPDKNMIGTKGLSNRTNLLKEFLRDLPKIESHYCRAQSSKLYLEPNWDSKSALYRFYRLWSNSLNAEPLSQKVFDTVFADMNLSIFKPKKDECDQCVAFRNKNMCKEDYALHEIRKNEAREALKQDTESSNKVYCMDMQAVLMSPKSNVSALYFKMKLMVHNFTIYDIKTNNGYCFIWHEGAGGVTSNEYTSIISYFLIDNVLKDIDEGQKIIFYSDGCTSQNRNCNLSSALLNIAKQHNVVIEQKYLEKGHTQMPADSMHSLIERKLKNTTINVPADYISVCLNARRNPRPYYVKYLGFDFFKDFEKNKLLNSIRPGYKVGDPVVTDLRCIKYNPDGRLQYKLKHTDEFTDLQQRRPSKVTSSLQFMELPQLHKNPPSIKKEKWEHLQSVKQSIPKDFHSFYDELSYK